MLLGWMLEGRLGGLWHHLSLHFPDFCWALPLFPFALPLWTPFPLLEAQGILSYGVCVKWYECSDPTSTFFVLSHLESILFSQFIVVQQSFPGVITCNQYSWCPTLSTGRNKEKFRMGEELYIVLHQAMLTSFPSACSFPAWHWSLSSFLFIACHSPEVHVQRQIMDPFSAYTHD